MAEIIETETDNYNKMDPDPFDERHPSRADPNCALGHMLKVLFRKDTFMNKVCFFCIILLLFHTNIRKHRQLAENHHQFGQTCLSSSSAGWSVRTLHDLCSLVLLDQTQAYSTTIRLNLRVLVIYPWFQHVFLVIKHSFSVKIQF